jgi:hypothetical protein
VRRSSRGGWDGEEEEAVWARALKDRDSVVSVDGGMATNGM